MKKIAIVTGAAKGIGRACAIALDAAGFRVLAWDVDRGGLDDLAGQVPGVETGELDVTDVQALRRAFAKTVSAHGRIDVLVNNAGITRRADLLELTEDDWDRITGVNAKGAFFCMQEAARQMTRQGDGRIINMASVAGKGFHNSSNVIYAGTKGALIAMTRMVAHKLGSHGITVNAVCPGTTETEIVTGLIERDAETQGISIEESRSRMFEMIPLKRANTTEDVAALVTFLASDGARNITGQAISVDGGLLMA